MNPHRNELDAALARISALEREANRDDKEIERLKGEVERLRNPDPEAARAKSAARRRVLTIGALAAALLVVAIVVTAGVTDKGALTDVNAVAVTLPGGKPGLVVKGYDGRSPRLDVYDLTSREVVGSWDASGRGGVRAMAAGGDGRIWIRRRGSLQARSLPSLGLLTSRPLSEGHTVYVDGASGATIAGTPTQWKLRKCAHGVVRERTLSAQARERCQPAQSIDPGRVGALGTEGDKAKTVRQLSFASTPRFIGKFVYKGQKAYSFERSLDHDGRALFVSKVPASAQVKPQRASKTYPMTQPAFVVDPRYGARVIALPKGGVLVAHRLGPDIALDAVSLADGSQLWRRTLGVVEVAACFRTNDALVVVTRSKERSELWLIDPASGRLTWKKTL
ncbi:MAG: hypothetical protein KC503_08160 [Myxococcales bacterium]|nr:hypothetical protein [Myxococcales bacterium]